LRERTRLERAIEGYRRIEREVDEAVGLIELGEAEGDKASVAEAESNLEKLREEARKREVESLLSGEADGNDCYLEVHAGAGGTEAQDWAEMLLRMYVRWAEDHGYKIEWLEESAGEGAGIKSATVKVSGVDAYGWLKTESGVHRLVRISPFDSNARRHTSFASVWVYPVID
jgi:peptide chain release factor 2